ncbi:MAG TPA: hypothetical protein VFX74_09375 [Candidatus Limnocylindria bacterium]|nr:hypothetical protein [Candidatus Limnocylindria bacterium]
MEQAIAEGVGPAGLHPERREPNARCSLRRSPGAPVSAPIAWEELDDPELRPNRWTIHTIGERLSAVGDLFAPVLGSEQALPKL